MRLHFQFDELENETKLTIKIRVAWARRKDDKQSFFSPSKREKHLSMNENHTGKGFFVFVWQR